MRRVFLSILFILVLNHGAYSKELKCNPYKSLKNWDNCVGEHVYPDGIYNGEFKSGIPHGEGKWISKDGSIYTGGFNNFQLEGKGFLNVRRLTFPTIPTH